VSVAARVNVSNKQRRVDRATYNDQLDKSIISNKQKSLQLFYYLIINLHPKASVQDAPFVIRFPAEASYACVMDMFQPGKIGPGLLSM
jgi:hypothetical protein